MANFLHGRAPTFKPSKLIYEFIQNIYTPTHTISRRTISRHLYLYIWYLQHIWYANQLKHDFGIKLAYPRAQCRQLWIPTVQGNITYIGYTLKYFLVLNFLTFKTEFKIVWPYIIILELVWKHLNLCFKKFDRSVTPSPFLNYMSAFCKLFIQLFFIDISRSLPRETIR